MTNMGYIVGRLDYRKRKKLYVLLIFGALTKYIVRFIKLFEFFENFIKM